MRARNARLNHFNFVMILKKYSFPVLNIDELM
jgi:hypothetical protein